MMKKWIKNVIIINIILVVICATFWKIGWISLLKEVAGLYGILVIVIFVSTVFDYLKRKMRDSKRRKQYC